MDRVVVVSGGGTGIGRATAEAFARQGEEVVLVGRRAEVLAKTAAEIGGAGGRVVALPADVADPAQVRQLTDEIVGRWQRVDVLVNAAGGNALFGPEPEPPLEGLADTAWHWTENFRLNTLTAVLLTEALKPHLSSPGGRVLLLSSIAAYRGSGSGSYAGSKAALHPYAYDLAGELGRRQITVNVVAPGYVRATEFFAGQLSDERERMLIGQALNERAGTPEDVAETVRWLASPEAGHVTAQIIQVNGGAERGR
ncbi:SDR family NAD(P)-dependent oxidoreductase [Micromonospora sp. DT233]|uniref:SDR family NAD(P)-dependent oxidoreductase n=1 Tax=Micromonospora sp. DT233 TaxID=3393432 RepID=UPI003CE8E8F9